MRSLVLSVCLYGCETWTLTVELQRKIQVTEMKCYRKILIIRYSDRIRNEEIRQMVERSMGPQQDFLTTVKKRKLRWYGHISRSDGMAKNILQGIVGGVRRRRRQRKRWEDNIREWTGLSFAESQRAVEDRDGWRRVIQYSLVPQRHPPDVMG
ncbi:hypothetical protein Pcinc_017405 [Petrolisthes cinctipes]|uniref:Endonuclease-reverse transcriptase n=1 Tax=Petrolisthes cinctipes TaxID=88211 RepID=A0AAE1FRK4_PETCI|nr:hypothetical protein Pcinc_017405 [Petrolisthes cinctipes]